MNIEGIIEDLLAEEIHVSQSKFLKRDWIDFKNKRGYAVDVERLFKLRGFSNSTLRRGFLDPKHCPEDLRTALILLASIQS